MKRKYWFLEREWWLRREAFHKGPVSRAFILWRSHPQWYMHRALRDHCSEKEDAVDVTVDAVCIAMSVHGALVLDTVLMNAGAVAKLEASISPRTKRRR